jgi:hypothetical protein
MIYGSIVGGVLFLLAGGFISAARIAGWFGLAAGADRPC